METYGAARSGTIALDRKLLVGVGAVSVLTMPISAVSFLLAGFAAFMVAPVAAMLRPAQGRQLLAIGGSVGLGLLLGPSIYLGLAVLT